MSLRIGSLIVFAAVLGAWPPPSLPEDREQWLAVLELFTSQGCSSCPPADALLKTFAGRRDVVALTLAVDYWDHLGWRDTFANAKHTERQRAYAKARGDNHVYTPQAVVNGVAHTVGSRRQDIEELIARTNTELAAMRVPIRVISDRERDVIVIETGNAAEAAKSAEGTIWLARVQAAGEVTIPRGENRGKTLTYYNIVRELTPVGMWWGGQPTTLRLQHSAVLRSDIEKCAVLVQQGTTGAIVGAAWMKPRP